MYALCAITVICTGIIATSVGFYIIYNKIPKFREWFRRTF